MESLVREKNNKLAAGFKLAKSITKKHAKTFYFAAKFLPKEKRLAAYAIYAVCRISDDSVDINKNPRNALNSISNNIKEAYSNVNLQDPLLFSFQETINKYQIPLKYFTELLLGMDIDLTKRAYLNFEELYDYCYKVAGVVGLIMLKVFGYKNIEAEKYAVKLGVAMQLTNILRDIKEDYERQRIYLPLEEMNKFDVTNSHIAHSRNDNSWKGFMDFEIKRAREYYQESTPGIKMITDPKCRLTTALMKNLYAGILKAIENNHYNVFTKRAHVNIIGKIIILLKVILIRK